MKLSLPHLLSLLPLALSLAPPLAAVAPTGTVNRPCPGLINGMDYVKLGSSDLLVSKVCMGTMTYGRQNTLAEGVTQLTRAFDHYGVNFIDTAEMYPVPTTLETQGETDKAVNMFMKTRKRSDVILATKIAGTSNRIDWLRKGMEGEPFTKITKEQVEYSIDESLKRLGTDYIDLIQLHWPDRYVGGMFGSPDYDPEKETTDADTSFEEQLAALDVAVKAGKVRYIGVSNETPYGVVAMSTLADRYPDLYPKIVSIQNSYSLVVRKDYESGLTEACAPRNCNVGLLAYSPLAGGVLTGKYNQKVVDPKARMNLFPGFMERYLGSQSEAAAEAYGALATAAGLTPSELALSWCYHREGIVASTIIGATSMEQLEENLGAYGKRLDEETMKGIGDVYKQYTDPTKAYGIKKK